MVDAERWISSSKVPMRTGLPCRYASALIGHQFLDYVESRRGPGQAFFVRRRCFPNRYRLNGTY